VLSAQPFLHGTPPGNIADGEDQVIPAGRGDAADGDFNRETRAVTAYAERIENREASRRQVIADLLQDAVGETRDNGLDGLLAEVVLVVEEEALGSLVAVDDAPLMIRIAS
jgi:hypothetical protein